MIGKTATIKRLGQGWTGAITAAGFSDGWWVVCGIQCRESDLFIHSDRSIADNLWRTCGMLLASGENEKSLACSAAWAEYVCREDAKRDDMKRFAESYMA